MPKLLDTTNAVVKLALMVLILVILFMAFFWFSASIYAFIADRLGNDEPPKLPDIKEARYEVRIASTGETLATDKFTQLTDNFYILHGYWEVKDGKYRYHEIDLPLDEKLFGEIIIERRRE